MFDIIKDTVLDSVRLLPFLFIAFLIIEFFEHKLKDKSKKVISKSKKFGPLVGSILGIFPQCGFSVIATNFYITRIISLGTLISIYLSTSDEMLPILLSEKVPLIEIVKILFIKIFISMLIGIIIDILLSKKETRKIQKEELDCEICHDEHCGCEKSILKSAVFHKVKTLFFILVVSFFLNIAFHYIDSEILSKTFMKNNIFAPFLTSLIGLIPSCGASIMITELFLNEVINFSSLIAGLLTGSGVAILLLFKQNKNKKENILILLLVYLIGSISGVVLELIRLLIE